ncbi:MAG: radical SAM protein [Methanomassiliicoccales archaeon]
MTMYDLFSFDGNTTAEGYRITEAKRALSPSGLPGLDYALNPYGGCEHGCLYCYAPNILHLSREEWGREVKVKANLPLLLSRELKGREGVIGIGTVTDPYQPVEREARITRKCLQVIARHGNRASLHTKSDLVLRDLDLLRSSVEVGVTITGIDERLSAVLEPGAPSPVRRLEAVAELVGEGIDAYVLVGPLLPSVGGVEEFARRIARTGVRTVMLDRFRSRPGMCEHMRKVMIEHGYDGKDFVSRLGADHPSGGLEESLRERGLECVRAF